MFIRFVTPVRDAQTGAETGFFRAASHIHHDSPDWIVRDLDEQFDWFDQHLPIPDRVARHFKRRRPVAGVCWFADHADEHIDRARYCAFLITEAGLPVELIKMRGGREIIWRDRFQAVIKPLPETPRAFAGCRY